MNRILVALVAAAALAVPAAALADNAAPTASATASATCKADRAKLGAATFALTYRNLGACVSKTKAQAAHTVANAAQSCKTEQAMSDADFGAQHDGKTFAAYYGSNAAGKNGKGGGANAFGKCVVSKVQQTVADTVTKTVTAAKSCKSQKADAATFAQNYGTGRNAFGKCVSKASKTS